MNFLRILSRDREQPKSQAEVLKRIDDDVTSMVTRGRFMGEKLAFGPNFVHAYIMRGESGKVGAPGSVEDLGWSHNVKTNNGMDWLHHSMGGLVQTAMGSPATAVSATSITTTGTPGWASNALAGCRIVAPITGITTAPVYTNALANTTGATPTIAIDGWWTGTDVLTSSGGTPAATNAFMILPGQGPARFIGLTTNTGAPAVTDTALTGEITANGLQRAACTFAHTTGGANYVYTLVKTFSSTGDHANVHKAGNFTGGYGAAGGGVLVADTNLNADATLANGDSLAVTWTWTLPAPG